MRALSCAAILGMLAGPLPAQVSGNVISRVFQLRVGSSTGTAFIIDHEDRQYLITANHMVEGLPNRGRIEIFNDSRWQPLDVRIAHSERPCIDVAAMAPAQKKLTVAEPLPMLDSFFIGQEVYFLGFPYGLSMQLPNMHFSAPLIKHGYTSAVVECSIFYPGAAAGDRVVLLDGLNNPGFSGGPVIVHDLDAPNRPLKVIGVMSGFRNEPVPVVVDGQRAANASVATNTGIILAVPFQRVLELVNTLSKAAESEEPK